MNTENPAVESPAAPKSPGPATINVPAVVKSEIVVDESGLVRPRSLDEMFRVATGYFRSGLLPKRYDSPEMVFTAMQFAAELGLKQLTALRQIAVVNGTPSLFGDLPLSLVHASGKLATIDEYLITQDKKRICAENGNIGAPVWGAVCYVERKGDPKPREVIFTMDNAKQASLSSPTWKAYPQIMLKYRARSEALKDKFGDVLNGIAIAEYDYNMVPEENSGRYVVELNGDKKSGGPAAELAARLRGEEA